MGSQCWFRYHIESFSLISAVADYMADVCGIQTGHFLFHISQGVVVGAPEWNRAFFGVLFSVILKKLVHISLSRVHRAFLQKCVNGTAVVLFWLALASSVVFHKFWCMLMKIIYSKWCAPVGFPFLYYVYSAEVGVDAVSFVLFSQFLCRLI